MNYVIIDISDDNDNDINYDVYTQAVDDLKKILRKDRLRDVLANLSYGSTCSLYFLTTTLIPFTGKD